jgi:hypothetical protein
MIDGAFVASEYVERDFSEYVERDFPERYTVQVQHKVFGSGPDSVPFGPWYGYERAAAAADIWNAGHPDSEYVAVVHRLYDREQMWTHNPTVAMVQAS